MHRTPGGEGPEHLRLKNAIAKDPETLLGEKGLALYAKEYAFPTTDQADVVLRDSLDRYKTYCLYLNRSGSRVECSTNLAMSLVGARPKKRPYSRLNCEAL